LANLINKVLFVYQVVFMSEINLETAMWGSMPDEEKYALAIFFSDPRVLHILMPVFRQNQGGLFYKLLQWHKSCVSLFTIH
jgi:hypothetical protein